MFGHLPVLVGGHEAGGQFQVEDMQAFVLPAFRDVAFQVDQTARHESGHLVRLEPGLLPAFADDGLARRLPRGHAAADQVVQATGIGGLRSRAPRDPQVRRTPGRIGDVAVAVHAQRQHPPEPARGAFERAVRAARAVPQRIRLVAPAHDQPLRVQPRVDLRKARVPLARGQAQHQRARGAIGRRQEFERVGPRPQGAEMRERHGAEHGALLVHQHEGDARRAVAGPRQRDRGPGMLRHRGSLKRPHDGPPRPIG